MSKKDYIQFAKMIKERREHIEKTTSENLGSKSPDYQKQVALDAQFYDTKYYADQMATIFQADNPNFNKQRFLTACGITAEG